MKNKSAKYDLVPILKIDNLAFNIINAIRYYAMTHYKLFIVELSKPNH